MLKRDFMKKILAAIIMFCGLNSFAYADTAVNNQTTESTKDSIVKALNGKDRLFEFNVAAGATKLNRDTSNPVYKLNVDPLYEVTGGVILLPDTTKLSLSYTTTLKQSASQSGSKTSKDSSASKFDINIQALESPTYGNFNLGYYDLILNGTLQNTSSSNLYVLDQSGTPALVPGDTMGTTEKGNLLYVGYMPPFAPDFGVLLGSGQRQMPAVVENVPANGAPGLGSWIAFANGKAIGNFYGVGYYKDIEKVEKNKLALFQLSYLRGDLNGEAHVVLNNSDLKFKVTTEVYFIQIGYKLSFGEVVLDNKYFVMNFGNNNLGNPFSKSLTDYITSLKLVARF